MQSLSLQLVPLASGLQTGMSSESGLSPGAEVRRWDLDDLEVLPRVGSLRHSLPGLPGPIFPARPEVSYGCGEVWGSQEAVGEEQKGAGHMAQGGSLTGPRALRRAGALISGSRLSPRPQCPHP